MLRFLKLSLLLIVCVGGLLCFPQVRKQVLPPVAGWLDIDESPECTPFVMILPGDEIRRGLTAAAIVRLGLAQRVLIPQNRETADVADGITLPTAQISRKILLHRGIAADRIVLLPSESRTTFDDAQALAEFLRSQEATVTVVTSAFHTRRARFVFDTVFGSESDRIRVLSAPNPGFLDSNWWQQENGLRHVLTEYIKLTFYHARYGQLLRFAGLVLLMTIGMWQWRARRRRKLATRPTGPL